VRPSAAELLRLLTEQSVALSADMRMPMESLVSSQPCVYCKLDNPGEGVGTRCVTQAFFGAAGQHAHFHAEPVEHSLSCT
jgi:hypothetical protein